MITKFISTEGKSLEAIVEVDGHVLHVRDKFGGERLAPGKEIDLQIEVGLYDETEQLESVFQGNPIHEKKLEHQKGWIYRAYGIITSINPVIADCGLLHLEMHLTSNDERLIGEAIAFTIERLDANLPVIQPDR